MTSVPLLAISANFLAFDVENIFLLRSSVPSFLTEDVARSTISFLVAFFRISPDTSLKNLLVADIPTF